MRSKCVGARVRAYVCVCEICDVMCGVRACVSVCVVCARCDVVRACVCLCVLRHTPDTTLEESNCKHSTSQRWPLRVCTNAPTRRSHTRIMRSVKMRMGSQWILFYHCLVCCMCFNMQREGHVYANAPTLKSQLKSNQWCCIWPCALVRLSVCKIVWVRWVVCARLNVKRGLWAVKGKGGHDAPVKVNQCVKKW